MLFCRAHLKKLFGIFFLKKKYKSGDLTFLLIKKIKIGHVATLNGREGRLCGRPPLAYCGANGTTFNLLRRSCG
jgi:hypothetical protein